MKVINTAQNSMSLERSIYEKIAAKFGKQITIMKFVAKDQSSSNLNFRSLSKIKKQAEQIATKSEYVSTPSEVHRAAHYLGVCILYHLLMKEDYGFKGSPTFESIMATEKINHDLQQIDDCLEAFEKISDSVRKGIRTQSESKEIVDDIISSLPNHLHDYAIEMARRLAAGENLTALFHKRVRGKHLKLKK